MSKVLHTWVNSPNNTHGFSCSTCKRCGLNRTTSTKLKLTQYTTAKAKFNIAPACKQSFFQLPLF